MMKRFIILVLTLLAINANAAILCQSPNGGLPYAPATLAAAVASPSCRNTSVVVTTALSAVQSNISSATVHAWPSDRALEVRKGGSIGNTTAIEFPSDAVLTVAKNQYVFTGTGVIRGLKQAWPELFGANTTPGTTDMTTAVQKAVDAVQGEDGATVLFSDWYKVTSAINITKYVKVSGTGKNSGIVNATTTSSAAFIVDGSGSAFPYANYSKFADFSITGNATTSGSGIKYLDRAAYLQFDRLYLEGNNHGIWHYAPPNSGGTARSTWGSSYGAVFNSVYAKANYGNGFYDDSTDNPDPGAQFNSCVSEQNAVGIDWGSGEVSVVGGVYQADVGGEVVFRARASLLNVYFEVAVADYAGGSVVDLYGYGSSIQGCTFNTNTTQNIKHISYRSTTVIDGNIFAASGSPVGCIGIYNASGGQAYTASKIFNNINNGTTTFQSLGTAELFYQDSAGATHLSSVITTGTVISGGKVTLGVAATGATNQVEFSGLCSAGAASNNSLFIDSATGKLSFRNAAGVTTALY